MDPGINIFINGMGGVFFGMAVLYVTIKIIALIAPDRRDSEDKS